LSEASGVPAYRGESGSFWSKGYGGFNDPNKILTSKFARENPELIWESIFDYEEIVRESQPNDGHLAIEKFLSW